MLRGPRDVGNGLDHHAIVVSLKGCTQNRQLLMHISIVGSPCWLRSCRPRPSARPYQHPARFDAARDAANGTHRILGDVGAGERSTTLLRQLQPDDSQYLVEAFEDARRYAGPLVVQSAREIAGSIFQPCRRHRAPGPGPAAEPKVRRVAFDYAFAPSTMNSLGIVGSSPRETMLSSKA